MEIINYKQINKGCLLSRFDVKIPAWSMTIRNCSHFKKDGKEWLTLPSTTYEKDGKPKSFEQIYLEKEARTRFDAGVLERIRKGEYQIKQEQQQQQVTDNRFPF